ncbi:hypothetical protein FQZ97_887490 [compost metagenome]
MGQHFDAFEQAGSVQGAGEELLAAGAHRRQAGRCVGVLMAVEQQGDFLFQVLLHRLGQLQAGSGAGEVDVHEDGGRMPFEHRRAERIGAVQRLRVHAEVLQLLRQALGPFEVLQSQVHRFAQRRQGGLLEAVAAAQAGARQALHEQIELADQVAVEAPAVVCYRLQASTDALRQLKVLGLLEALGISLQQQRGIAQFAHAALVPLVALQALPDLQYLPCLMDHALGEVLLEAVVTGVFVLGHGPDSIWGGGSSLP